ncbi:LapA family protein [Mariprofundus erugo]|uniref:LapA family protein n=1 Tax=Mariprofundus erugo TaxID=2528639 RepID=A0A5R9GTE1_9PROT|nr:LapA family protein [Mariprofundus erugo]TLS66524.1 LapA family protein [Mariprofundus erugo]TLS77846.1 LapA family protein [Mariprofundus erugo]
MPRYALHLPGLQSVNWINVLVVFVLTSFATMFALANLTPVQLHFLGVSSAAIPVYIPVFIAFILGFSGGVLALTFSRRKHKLEIAWLRQEHERLQREVDNLRNIPLQDDV